METADPFPCPEKDVTLISVTLIYWWTLLNLGLSGPIMPVNIILFL
jgi:hypothetical protein